MLYYTIVSLVFENLNGTYDFELMCSTPSTSNAQL
jgi:hypothetical protein